MSPQSRPVASRAELEAAVERLREQYPDGAVPRPATWGGYRLVPHTYEFWQHDRHRMHDRFRYTSADGGLGRRAARALKHLAHAPQARRKQRAGTAAVEPAVERPPRPDIR